jgi:hypothetical protein
MIVIKYVLILMMNKAYTFVSIYEQVANRLYNKYKDM